MEKYKLRKFEDKIRIEREIEILKKVKHPNIVQLYSVIEAEKQIFLIMEYIKGEELFQYILLKKKLSEEEACFFFHQIISGIEYLHKLKIAHRDIKSENMIIENDTKNLKILDFGLSNTYGDKPNEMLSTACGSPCYTPPEMLCGKMYKGGGVDIWSAGVVLFSMICGFMPFYGESHKETYIKIIEGKYSVPAFVSKIGSELIHNLLNSNPKKRINISQIKKHYWIKLYSNGLNSEGKSLFNVGLIIDKFVIPIDEDIVVLMEKFFKIPKIKTRLEVLSNNSNEYTTLYYLLVKIKINNGKKSIADFKSDLFLNYLEDKNNLMSHYKNDINNVLEARKMGVLFEQDIIYRNKNNNLYQTESNVKSQDNLLKIYSKNNIDTKTITSFNSSSNLKINFNKKYMLMKSKKNSNNNSSNNIINVRPSKKLKNKINIIFEKNNEQNIKKIINKCSAKTARNFTNINLKSFSKNTNKNKTVQKNQSDFNSFKDLNKIISLNTNSTLSPINTINKSHQPIQSHKNMKIMNIKKSNRNYGNIIKNRNKEKTFIRKTTTKKVKAIKYSHDEIEEEKYEKSTEEPKQEKIFTQKEIGDNYNIKIKKIINYIEKNGKNRKKDENIPIRNDDSKKIIAKYKETISPSIEARNTINNNAEINLFNTIKTLESITLQTINQEKFELSSNNFSVKNMTKLNRMNTFSDKEEEEKKNNINIEDNLLSYKKKKLFKKDKKTSKLLKNMNTQNFKSKNNLKIDNDKKTNKKNTYPIKKALIEKNNNNNGIKSDRLYNTYKKKNFTKNNNDSNDHLTKKSTMDNLTNNKKFNKHIKNNYSITNNNYIIPKIEDIKTKILMNNNKKNKFNKKNANIKLNFREKINKIINNTKNEKDNTLKNKAITDRKFQSAKKEKNNINNRITEDYKKDFNDQKSHLKILNTENSNFNLQKNNKTYKPKIKTKKLTKKENKIKHNKTDNKNYLNCNKDSQSILINSKNNPINSDIKMPININLNANNNFNNDNLDHSKNNNNTNLELTKNLSYYLNKQEKNNDNANINVEPFDLSCVFYSSRKKIKNLILKTLQSSKHKIKSINSYRYRIYCNDNDNVYEFNLPYNNLGIIKFIKIKGNYNVYTNNLKKIVLNFK